MDTQRRYTTYIFTAALIMGAGCGGGNGMSSTNAITMLDPVVDLCAETSSSNCGIQTNSSVSLSWDTPVETVDGYLIYMGSTPEDAEMPIGDFPYASLALIDSALSVTIDLAETAPMVSSESVCFRLRSYNVYGISNYSNTACLSLIPPA